MKRALKWKKLHKNETVIGHQLFGQKMYAISFSLDKCVENLLVKERGLNVRLHFRQLFINQIKMFE